MMMIRRIGTAAFLALSASTTALVAQDTAATADEQIATAAATIQDLVTQLTARAEGYPDFVAELQEGLVTIEQADEQVRELIASLTEATTQLEDGSDVDNAIDDYLAVTRDLIAEADGSTNEAIRGAIPGLEATAEDLIASDRSRGELVIEARNLIRTLEQDQEALAFFIRANQVQQAAEMIAGNIEEFGRLVENGNTLASSLLETVER